MSSAANGGTQLVTMLVTYLLIAIPLAILNANIAKRKGRSGAKFGWLTMIPFAGVFFSIYLASLTDKELIDKIDKILESITSGGGHPPHSA